MTVLTHTNLAQIDQGIARPSYDRSQLKTGIVHIGVGGFHRSHEAYYTDLLLEQTGSKDWGICGIGLREGDRKIAQVLEQQDYLYTLVVKHPNGGIQHRVIGSIVDFILAPDSPQAVIDKMAHQDTKIVSLTITEGGYNFLPATGEFDFSNPDIQHDLANPESPKSVFGYLTAALRLRREQGFAAFTVQSCDNIQHNGNMTRKMLLAFAERQDSSLASWIAQEVAFPNAMVDRITPVTTLADIQHLADAGIEDQWPVVCEPFTQWVIEDQFSHGRPAWEQVGAQFVADVTPYETMKIRLLNAGHSVLGLLGSLYGHDTIDTCVADPLFAQYLRNFMDEEATPVLAPVEGIDLNLYKDTLIERFGNPNVKDNLARICLESSSKLPKFLIATINENLAKNGSIRLATLVLAAWCYYSDKGQSLQGEELDIVDDMKEQLHKAAQQTAENSLAFLSIKEVFGDLLNNPTFTQTYSAMVNELYQEKDIASQMVSTMSGVEQLTA
ncbi:mannitol dehydrogenase family protein [Marinomonas epiphytica]